MRWNSIWLARGCCLLACVTLAATPVAGDDDVPPWYQRLQIGGLVFGDAYAVAANHDETIDGENGFWFRRLYLTFDAQVADDFDLRLRFEGNSPGDFTDEDSIDVYLKDLYLQWRLADKDLFFGLSPAPAFPLVEEVWGYRSVEKTPLDLQRMVASRDTGVALKGRFGAGERFGYHVMLGNGSGTRSETDPGKRGMAAFSFHPAGGWVFQVYAETNNRPGDTDRTTYQGFAGYRGKRQRWGLQYARQVYETGPDPDLDLDIASLFGVLAIKEKLSLLGRVDRMFDPNPEGDDIPYLPFDPTADSLLVILGLDFALRPRISFIPNVEAVFYDNAQGAADPDNDLIVRATLFARF